MWETAVNGTRVTMLVGDITEQEVDAVVNAANSSLLGGSGVDGAIHRAGGPGILEECKIIRRKQGGCPTGEAVITTGGKLPAKYVIHTVGPVWRGGDEGESEYLKKCYLNSLEVAAQNNIKTIAFPAISTGAYGYPKEEAAVIALSTVRKALDTRFRRIFEEIRFVLFHPEDLEIYLQAWEGL